MLRPAALLALCGLACLSVPALARPRGAAVLDAINFARTQPQAYADSLRDFRRNYRGRLVDLPGERDDVMTREGVGAVDEAIAFVERQRPLPPLQADPVLADAARDHAIAQGERGDVGHVSADGASPGQRVIRRGGGPYISETIAYGSADPATVVRQLIVDDGVADRGHRAVIFDTRLGHAGAGCGAHAVYRAMCVIDFSAAPAGRASRPR
ncbi:MAG: CAP domain-containing protein [Polymorphobacter sp.]